MPSVLALSLHQWNFLPWQYVLFEYFNDPAFKAVHLEAFNFNPDTQWKLSKTLISVSNDFFEPSVKNVASSANKDYFTSCPAILTPRIFMFCEISYDKSSMHTMKR